MELKSRIKTFFLFFVIMTVVMTSTGLGNIHKVYAAVTIDNHDGMGFSGSIDGDALSGTISLTGYNGWPSDVTLGNGAFASGVYDGQNIWLIPFSNGNPVVKIDGTTGAMTSYANWPGDVSRVVAAFVGGVFDGRNIWMIPFRANHLVRLDTQTGAMTSYALPANAGVSDHFYGGVFDGQNIWMIPYNSDVVMKVDKTTGSMTGYTGWPSGFTKSSLAFAGGVYDGTNIWMIPGYADRVVKFNTVTGEMTGYNSWPAGFIKGTGIAFIGGTFDGTHVWLIPANASHLVKIDPLSGEMTGYNNWPAGFTKPTTAFAGAIYDGQHIWLTPASADRVMKVDPSTGDMTGYNNWPTGFTKGIAAFRGGVYDGHSIWMVPANADRVIRVMGELVQNSTISPTTSTFDKYSSSVNYKDITVTMTLKGNTLSDIKLGATSIGGTNYSVNGNDITIKKEYLATLATGTHVFTFDMNAGTDPTLSVTVSDSTPLNSTLNPTSATFDKYSAAAGYADVTTTLTPNGNTLSDIKLGATTIGASNYSINANNITIKKEYLATLTTGTHVFTFDMNAGTDPTLSVTVSDSSPLNSTLNPTSATFDKYTADAGYADVTTTLTPNGNTLSDIKLGATSIGGTNYSVNGNDITIKKEYLATLATGTHVFTFDMNAGTDPTLSVTVSDSTPLNSTLNPTSATFDKYTADAGYADVTTTLTPNGNTLSDIKLGATSIGGTNYSVNANDITIKKEYLASLGTGTHVFTFDMNAGTDPTLSVTVSDSTPQNSTLSPTSATFDKYTADAGYADVTTTLTPNGNTLSDIKLGATTIGASNYSVIGNDVTIKKEYLATLGTGTHVFTFDMNAGTDPTLSVTVSDSTPLNSSLNPTSATFDKYTADAGYADVTTTLTPNGNTLSDIKLGATSIGGTNYSVNANDITIKKEYLATLATGTHVFTFDMNAGTDPTLSVTVSDSSPLNSSLNPISATFDKYTADAGYADVTTTITPNGNTFNDILLSGTSIGGTNYSVNTNNITIKKEYLASLVTGTHVFTFDMNAGTDPTLSVTVSDSTPVTLDAPVLQPAVPGNKEVNLAWSTVNGATGYKIYQGVASGTYTEIAHVLSNVSTYTVTGLTNGTTYYFAVTATSSGDESNYSNERSTTPKTVPAAPTNVTATPGVLQATISFTEPSDNGGSTITRYIVTSSQGNFTETGIASPITVNGLMKGTTYTFTVRAENEVGLSDPSQASNPVTPQSPVQNVEITAVSTLAPVTNLPNGTAKTASALGLPNQVEVTLEDASTLMVHVKWDVDHADYDPMNKEAQSFTVTGDLIRLPDGVTNGNNLRASIRVSVDAALDGDIVAVENPDDITGLPNGTAKDADALGLPEQVRVTLDNGSSLQVKVKWDVDRADYDPLSEKAQRFTVSGELVKLPNGVTNSQNHKATIHVQVKAADDETDTRKIVKVKQPEAITDIENGTRKTASALGLPEQVKVTLDDDSTISVDVKWDVKDADYDPESRKKQRFTVNGKLVHLPDGVENPENLSVSISVTVDAAPREKDRDDDKNDSGSGSRGDSTSGNKESTRQVKVEAGNDNSLSEQMEITRKSSAEGKQVDEVVFDRKKAREILEKAEQYHKDVVRITIDDLPNDPADEISVKVPKNSLELIQEQQVALEIKTGDAIITIPREMVAALPVRDLYFRVVPIQNPAEKQIVTQRTLDAEEVKQAAGGQDVQVVGKPMVIETNYSNHRTKVTFPLQDVKLPTDPDALRTFLSSLAVYVEHTDGQKELKSGEIKYDDHGKPVGIEIEITKFSTFTILSLQGKQESVEHKAYMTGYPNGTFQPNRIMTRAEIAVVLAHFLNEAGQHPAAETTAFSDVPTSHWAAPAIQQVKDAGLMKGDAQGLFHPHAKVTRAEMATILVKWKKLMPNGQVAAFTDTQGHWATASIAIAVEQGMMKGYTDGSFRPNHGLTRAEAATLFNRLTGRGPLTGIMKAISPDVPLNHWAFAEIAEATLPHSATKQVNGTEKVTNQQ